MKLLSLVIFVVIVFILIYNYSLTIKSRCLNGSWVSTDEFADKSEITAMIFNIEPECNGVFSDHKKAQVIIIGNDGKYLMNENLDVKINYTLSSVLLSDNQLIPTKLSVEYDPYAGKLRLFSDDEIVADLRKNCYND